MLPKKMLASKENFQDNCEISSHYFKLILSSFKLIKDEL